MFSFIQGFLNFDAIGILGQVILCSGRLLCNVGCLAVALALLWARTSVKQGGTWAQNLKELLSESCKCWPGI